MVESVQLTYLYGSLITNVIVNYILEDLYWKEKLVFKEKEKLAYYIGLLPYTFKNKIKNFCVSNTLTNATC